MFGSHNGRRTMGVSRPAAHCIFSFDCNENTFIANTKRRRPRSSLVVNYRYGMTIMSLRS